MANKLSNFYLNFESVLYSDLSSEGRDVSFTDQNVKLGY